MRDNPVVPKPQPLAEDEFHAAVAVAIARMIKEHSKAKVALWMGLSVRQLRNIQAGSMPGALALWNLLAHDATAHDEIDAEYGAKNVTKDAVVATDPLTIAIITVAGEVAKAESPDSPGGSAVIDHELLAMPEPTLRHVCRTLCGWLDRIDTIRKPKLRGVQS